MNISEIYSHLNGEEFLLVRQPSIYEEIKSVISQIDAYQYFTKESKEKTMKGKMLFSPIELNEAFKSEFNKLNWNESRYSYYVTTNEELLPTLLTLPLDQQKIYLKDNNQPEPIKSYKQTDFVKNKIAVEVQFGKYAFVAFDLFVKHMLFYSGGIINLGVEILPSKKMQAQMSSGVAYFEGEVYNILRHGRNNPPIPLLIIGIEP
jgi:hypothetical protein